ncbi:MAG: hypothetical protein AB1696_27615 [Planctomycetota bacterium]
MGWQEKTVKLRVERSFDPRSETYVYRIWDEFMAIPRPENAISVQVYIAGSWEDMFFNKVWGRRYDPKGVGCEFR